MRLGIDLGTTRTVVAVVDRGNYPVVSFETDSGDYQPWYPSVMAFRGVERVFAFEAQARQYESGWMQLRTIKRMLPSAGPETCVTVGGHSHRVLSLLTDYLTQLREDLRARSNLDLEEGEALEAFIAVPANANNNQRFLTLEGFRLAGFNVLGMINEPSAAALEYTQKYRVHAGKGRREYILVYDLGGGTFDACLLHMEEKRHVVVTTEGVPELGGEDFDELLAALALSKCREASTLSDVAHTRLLNECRDCKEALHPNTRRIVLDLGMLETAEREVVVTTQEFYERCAPLISRTVDAVEAIFERTQITPESQDLAGIYLVGGTSELPAVGRQLRERYGRLVRKSIHPYASTAIGLAICADQSAGYELTERLTRYFGVWREAESGGRLTFDPIFTKDTPVAKPAAGAQVCTRTYQPAHNIGHFRYLECSQLNEQGEPAGDVTPWGDLFFPLDPTLESEDHLERLPVCPSRAVSNEVIRENYRLDQSGMIEVTISNQSSGYERTYRLANPAAIGHRSAPFQGNVGKD